MKQETLKEISKLKFESEENCPNCETSLKNSKVLYCKKYKGKIIDKKIICKNCGLIYKSQKMTSESNNFFYKKLYIKYMFGKNGENPYEVHYRMGMKRAPEIYLFSKEIINAKYPPLEIGCSSGGVLSILKEINNSSIGIDIDERAIEFAKKKGLHANDINLFDLQNKSRDFILMSHTIEHLDDLPRTLKKISNILIEGGKLLVFVPDSYEMLEPPHIPHNYCFSRDTLKSIISKHKLKEIKFVPISERPQGFKKDLIVLFKKNSKTKEYKSNYNPLPFLKYKYYLYLYSLVNPLFMITKTKPLFRKILKK